jgi:uncharacterized protein
LIESPCIRVCTLDERGELCLGCFRTLDEIGSWTSLTDPERERVTAVLPARKRQHAARAAGMVLADTKTLACSNCGASFGCGAEDPDHDCWCASFPPVTPSAARGSCLCPACLAAVATSTSRVT